ncbi:unnamed protein product, partial [Closterium sp. NIES-53]
GIAQSFTLPASPQQNGIVERRIGLIMEVACTCVIHVAAPYFLWSFAVRCTAHQLNLWPCVFVDLDLHFLGWGRLALRRRVGFGARLPLTAIPPWTSSLVPPFAAPSLAFPPRLAGSFTTPPRVASCPPRTSLLTRQLAFTASTPKALPPSPPPPLFLVPSPPSVDPLPQQGPAPSTEGGDPAADDTAATCRSPRLETPPGFPP